MNNNIIRAIEVFNEGGIVVFPTDTAYGIGCRMDNPASVGKIFDIKKRDLSDALLVLVNSTEMAEKYVEIPQDVREKLVNKFWPGGLSIFLNTKPGKVPEIVTANSSVLAVRWPDHPEIVEIIKAVGVPIIGTSANISGEPTPFSLSQVDKKILNQADFVLSGECTYKKESTIIDCTVEPWKVIRQGAVTIQNQEL